MAPSNLPGEPDLMDMDLKVELIEAKINILGTACRKLMSDSIYNEPVTVVNQRILIFEEILELLGKLEKSVSTLKGNVQNKS